MKRTQSLSQVRWDLALRYRLIETVAWWEGRLTTNHLMMSFGISRQQASKDINKYINEYAPENLTYDRFLKGYIPGKRFKPLFIDGSAGAYLNLLNQNHDRAPHIEGLALAYAHTEVLGIPDRPILPEVLRPLLRACREELRLEIEYVSFTTPKAETRLIAPHTLVNTGMRWHVRAYCEKNKAFRDFVLSRFRGQVDVLGASEFSSADDLGWNAKVDIIIEPDRRLNAAQQEIITHDFGMKNGRLVITARGALVKYVLQQYLLDPNNVRARASVQQISVANLDDLSVWL